MNGILQRQFPQKTQMDSYITEVERKIIVFAEKWMKEWVEFGTRERKYFSIFLEGEYCNLQMKFIKT